MILIKETDAFHIEGYVVGRIISEHRRHIELGGVSMFGDEKERSRSGEGAV